MSETVEAIRGQLARQVEHWAAAADELADLTVLASSASWAALEPSISSAVETALKDVTSRLRRHGDALRAQQRAAETERELAAVHRQLLSFRRRYLAIETTLDFYGDAISARTNAKLGSYLRACDYLARESMRPVLEPLGLRVPQVLTYVDEGLGASILKAGLTLWGGHLKSPVATIKIARHNLQRLTALLHETGHQVAHLTSWTVELSSALRDGLAGQPEIASLWSGWASELAGDAFAFAHGGFGAVAALCDVLAGEGSWVMRVDPIDPHPSGYVRILLGREMCRRYFGAGEWDGLARAWVRMYPLANASTESGSLFRASVAALPRVVEILFERSYAAFRGRSLAQLVDPRRVRPDALTELEQLGGQALYRSNDWVRREAVRLLALAGYRSASEPARGRAVLDMQQEWMSRLGELARAA